MFVVHIPYDNIRCLLTGKLDVRLLLVVRCFDENDALIMHVRTQCPSAVFDSCLTVHVHGWGGGVGGFREKPEYRGQF